MKNLLKLTLVLLLLVSCKDESESKESKIVEGLMNEITGKNDNINERYDLLMKDLSSKTLLPNEQLLEAFPKKIGALKLDSNEGRITSGKTVIGSFGDGTIRMEILDAAGENMTGAIIPLKMFHLNKVTSENNNTIRYSKKERDGVLTFGIDYDEAIGTDYQSNIKFLYDNRFYITLEGKGMNVDKLWDSIKIDDFKRYKEFNK